MAILTLASVSDPVLRQPAEPVIRYNKTLAAFTKNLRETMRAKDGVGLSAPQVGVSLRVLVTDYSGSFGRQMLTLVNPRIIHSDGCVLGDERCLSFPGSIARNIPRAQTIEYEAATIGGVRFRRIAKDWWARILQHEIDHLDGIVIRDRVTTPEDWQEEDVCS